MRQNVPQFMIFKTKFTSGDCPDVMVPEVFFHSGTCLAVMFIEGYVACGDCPGNNDVCNVFCIYKFLHLTNSKTRYQ